MKLLVTGTPGTGKTALSKVLAKHFKLDLINEKQFAIDKKIGKWDSEENELVIPVKQLEKELNLMLSKKNKVLIEGHLLCETRLKVDFAILLRVHPEILETTLESRGYSVLKVHDNVFAEGIDYCKKQLLKRYPEKKIIEVSRKHGVEVTAGEIIKEIEKVKK